MPDEPTTESRPDLLEYLETGRSKSPLPGGEELRKGRSPRDGFVRGWGLEYGGLAQAVAADPIFQECAALVADRILLAAPCQLNLYLLVRYFLPQFGPGAIVEFGSYRGGSAIFLAALCQRLGLDIKVYGLDTFAGMPATDRSIDAHSQGEFRDTSLDDLRTYTTRCGLDSHLTFVQGRFEETASAVLDECGPVVLAHIDCDIASAVAYAYDIVRSHMAIGGYIVFDDATASSCLGATETVEDLVIRRDGLNCEQIYPHFVFRVWPDYVAPHSGGPKDSLGTNDQPNEHQVLESRLLAAVEALVRLRHDQGSLRLAQAELHIQLQRHAQLHTQYASLEAHHSQLQEEQRILQQQIAMATRSRWVALGRLFGIGPRFS